MIISEYEVFGKINEEQKKQNEGNAQRQNDADAMYWQSKWRAPKYSALTFYFELGI